MMREKQPLEGELPNDLLHLIEKRIGQRRGEASNSESDVAASEEKREQGVDRRQGD